MNDNEDRVFEEVMWIVFKTYGVSFIGKYMIVTFVW